MVSEKYRKILRYIGWTVILLFITIYIIYRINPTILNTIGIDISSLAKYTILFFIIKGCITTSIIFYGWYLVKNKKIKKNE